MGLYCGGDGADERMKSTLGNCVSTVIESRGFFLLVRDVLVRWAYIVLIALERPGLSGVCDLLSALHA